MAARERWSRSRRLLRIQALLSPSQPDRPVTTLPAVGVTATTETIRGVLRVRSNASYTAALHSAGLRPFILPILEPSDADAMLEGLQGLVLTGGEDVDPLYYGAVANPGLGDVHGTRDGFELALVRAARQRRLPTLVICRGLQVANVALGGTLVQDLPSERPGGVVHDGVGERHDRIHAVHVDSASQLSRALNETDLIVNSFHHQAIATLASGLKAVAHAPDGVIEGIEWPAGDWWMLGVQWHPEELTATPERWDRDLFTAFAVACRTRAT